MKVRSIEIPIFFGTLELVKTERLEELNPLYSTNIKEGDYDAVVFVNQPEKGKIILGIKNTSWSVIAHEAVHVVNEIFLKCNIELDRKNDEVQAYLTGWVVDQVEQFLKANEDNIKDV